MMHYEAGGFNGLHQISMATSVFRCKWYLLGQQGRDWEGENWCRRATTAPPSRPRWCADADKRSFHDARSAVKGLARLDRSISHGVSRVIAAALHAGVIFPTRNDERMVSEGGDRETDFVDQVVAKILTCRHEFADDGALRRIWRRRKL